MQSEQPQLRKSPDLQSMHIEAMVSDAFAEVLGRVVAEKQREFDQIIAIRDAQFQVLKTEMNMLLREIAGNIRNDVDSWLADVQGKIDHKLANVQDGKPGEQGPPGERGEQGPRGDPGPQGEKGEAGPAGDTGETGPAGPAGEAGPQGPQGPEGAMGLTGPQGEPGMAGRDGQPGRDGLNGLQGERGAAGKDGKDGFDGKDGAGFDDWRVEYDGEREVTFICGSGERVKKQTITLPVPIYRGKWTDGAQYQFGDEVTFGGQVFRASTNTGEKPGPTSKHWVVSANRGRDGRDGKDGAQGERGPEGRPGRDLTQLGPDGKKW